MASSNPRLGIGCCLLVLQLGIWSAAVSQNVPPAEHDPEASPNVSGEGRQNPELEVEIVVFAYNAFNPAEEEVDRNHGRARPALDPGLTDGIQDATNGAPFRFSLLGPADLDLTAACDRLERLGAYTVLIHGGWIQEGLSEEEAVSFEMSLFGVPSIAGNLRVHLSRFIHVTAALDYYPPGAKVSPRPPISSSEREAHVQLPPKYVLRQSRRTRSGELHYLDHPAFGVLVTVRPHGAGPEHLGRQ